MVVGWGFITIHMSFSISCLALTCRSFLSGRFSECVGVFRHSCDYQPVCCVELCCEGNKSDYLSSDLVAEVSLWSAAKEEQVVGNKALYCC